MSLFVRAAAFLAVLSLGCSSGGSGTALGGAGGESGDAGAPGTGATGGTGGAATGGSSAGGAAGQGGAPSECSVDADCPPPSNECSVARCAAGQCKVAFLSVGTSTESQVKGDCAVTECDGRGAIVSVIDAADVSDDGNPCTTDACVNGALVHTPAPVGTSCGASLSCDANGTCIGCTSADQCPASDTECKTRVCAAGTCGFTYAPAGTLLTIQMRADCAEDHCDGAGGVTQYLDANDVLVDGSECTDDICNGIYPENPPSAAGTPCTENGGSMCDGRGTCAECLLDSDCGASTECLTKTCVDGACVAQPVAQGTATVTQTSGDCKIRVCDGSGSATTQNDDADLPNDNNPCTTDACDAGSVTHTPVAPGTLCGDGLACDASGDCAGCTTAAQCPGTDDECKTRTCDAAVCGFSYEPSGTALSTQTAGDCKELQCDGQGATQSVPVNDPPDDGNSCTADQCAAGTPSNPPLAPRTACGSGMLCDGGGACVDCLLASDCGTNGDCRTYACSSSNVCSHTDVADLTPIATQVAGDCKEAVCDGQGSVKSVNKDTDVLVDNKECTQDKCTTGVPSNPPLSSGTTCSAGVCDGNGSCSQCVTKSDCGTDTACRTYSCSSSACGHVDAAAGTACPGGVCDGGGACVDCMTASDCGTATECRTYSCTNHQCAHADTAAGTPVSTQAAGDCKKVVCDSGAMVTMNDATDVPADDGFECTDETCNAGVPEHPPLDSGASCSQNGGQYCDGTGACVECVIDDQCTSLVCSSGACQPPACDDLVMNGDETDVDCGGGTCDACPDGAGCVIDTDCISNNCAQLVCQPPN